MSEHKKTHPTAATVEQVQVGAEIEWSSISSSNDTTADRSRQIHISDFLGHGQEAAVPLRHLKEMTGLDGRTIRLMIEQERRAGVPLLSDNQHGYFMAADTRERDRFVRSMRGRAAEIEAVAAAVERAVIE